VFNRQVSFCKIRAQPTTEVVAWHGRKKTARGIETMGAAERRSRWEIHALTANSGLMFYSVVLTILQMSLADSAHWARNPLEIAREVKEIMSDDDKRPSFESPPHR
jgi:hypothetical protein